MTDFEGHSEHIFKNKILGIYTDNWYHDKNDNMRVKEEISEDGGKRARKALKQIEGMN